MHCADRVGSMAFVGLNIRLDGRRKTGAASTVLGGMVMKAVQGEVSCHARRGDLSHDAMRVCRTVAALRCPSLSERSPGHLNPLARPRVWPNVSFLSLVMTSHAAVAERLRRRACPRVGGGRDPVTFVASRALKALVWVMPAASSMSESSARRTIFTLPSDGFPQD